MDGQKERQGDFVFSANVVGDYSFCFDNEMSTFAEKYVDFEIAVENEARAQLPSKQGTTPEQTSVLEESIFKVSGQLSTISRNQKYFRTRENRNFATVNSTEGRIINFSMIQIGLIICMGALQVFVVRFFFQVCLTKCRGVTCADCSKRVRARVTYKGCNVPYTKLDLGVTGVRSKRRRILEMLCIINGSIAHGLAEDLRGACFRPRGCDIPDLDEADERCHEALDWTARDSKSCSNNCRCDGII